MAPLPCGAGFRADHDFVEIAPIIPRPRTPAAAATRERILAAAIRHFASRSYEDATLRAIAADAGVDVAWVHRSFGSKENLLIRAVEATAVPRRFAAIPAERIAEVLAAELFTREAKREDEIGPLDIVFRSVNSREVQPLLRALLADDFVGPLSAGLAAPAEKRALLLAAVLLGIGVLRDVLRIDGLRDPGDGELRALVVELLDHVVGAGTARPAPPVEPSPADEA